MLFVFSVSYFGDVTNQAIHRTHQIIPEPSKCWNSTTLVVGSMRKERFIIWFEDMD